MEINSKDELKSALDEIMSRLSVVEQSTTDKKDDEQSTTDKKDDEQSKEEKQKDETSDVESVDEIEKLLNS